MSLKDKEYESYRRIAPGRIAQKREPPHAWESEEYAQAVVGTDGLSLSAGIEGRLDELLYELRALRVAMTLMGTAKDLEDGVENRI